MAQAGSRPCHHPCVVGSAGIKNARITKLKKLPPRFQRKAWEARQCVAGSVFLQAAPEMVMQEALWVNPKLQWRPQDIGGAMNMEHLLRKIIGSKHSQPKREAMWAGSNKAIGAGLPKSVRAQITTPHAWDVR
jgi:hypothetical protein